MRLSQNVWIDGSLRDGAWFAAKFRSIRRRFPHYKIAIFEVGASEEVVRHRIKKRAAQTGRDVPEHLIVKSLESVASSLNILMPLADFVARINNDGETRKKTQQAEIHGIPSQKGGNTCQGRAPDAALDLSLP